MNIVCVTTSKNSNKNPNTLFPKIMTPQRIMPAPVHHVNNLVVDAACCVGQTDKLTSN